MVIRRLRVASSLSLVMAYIAVAQPAYAGTATANLDVLATVDPACTVTTTPVDFGTVDPSQNAAFLATGTVNVTCTSGTSWTAVANDGVNPLPAGAGFIRSMEGQTSATPAYLKYSLYTDAGRTVLWQSTTALTGVGTGSVQSKIVYGTVPSGQTIIPVDSYKDLVVVTVSY